MRGGDRKAPNLKRTGLEDHLRGAEKTVKKVTENGIWCRSQKSQSSRERVKGIKRKTGSE